MSFVVYQHTNTVNGKRYIGYSGKTLEQRFKGHVDSARLGSTDLFHQAIRKHGAKAFVSEVLFVEESRAGAKETEILLILDRQPEYNMTMGGDSGPIRSGSDHPMFGVARPDLAERNKNKIWTDEDRKAAAEKQSGKKASSETKLKMSNKRLGKKRGSYVVTSDGVSLSNKKRAGTEAAALAAKKASDARWAKHRAAKAAEQISGEISSE